MSIQAATYLAPMVGYPPVGKKQMDAPALLDAEEQAGFTGSGAQASWAAMGITTDRHQRNFLTKLHHWPHQGALGRQPSPQEFFTGISGQSTWCME